jgi:hypothetical protein
MFLLKSFERRKKRVKRPRKQLDVNFRTATANVASRLPLVLAAHLQYYNTIYGQYYNTIYGDSIYGDSITTRFMVTNGKKERGEKKRENTRRGVRLNRMYGRASTPGHRESQ